jgi:chorismate synthase
MLRFTTSGESHGRALVAILEGLPAALRVDQELINRELRRRQLGYGRGGRMKIEKDQAEILSGVRHGLALGSPIALLIENKDWPNWTGSRHS